MSKARREAVPVAGLALFAGAVAIVVVATVPDAPPHGAAGPSYRLLPTAPAPELAPGPRIAATPPPTRPATATPGQAGIWSTPAEFAPPD